MVRGDNSPLFSLIEMNADSQKQLITDFLQSEVLEDRSDLFLVDFVISGKSGNTKLTVEIDGDDGLPIEDVALVSRKMGTFLEEADVFQEKYTLEVTSPGLDKPLRSLRQYKKNVGRTLRTLTNDGEEIVGKLEEVREDRVVLEIGEKKQKSRKEIEFRNMEKSKIVVSFK